MTGFADTPTATLQQLRRNLLDGLDRVAAHLDAGTFHDIAPGRSSPPSQAGHLTLALLGAVNTELDERRKAMRAAVIVDIDGTLALMGKGIEGRRGPHDLHRVGEDDPNEPVIDLVRDFRAVGYRIIFMSGRDEKCRAATESWLLHHVAAEPGEPLFMRDRGDNRDDAVVKRELYERHVAPYWAVRYVLDDRDRVVRMWRGELGLTVLQVAEGDF